MDDYELALSFGNEIVGLVVSTHLNYTYFPNSFVYNPSAKTRFAANEAIVNAVINLCAMARSEIDKCYWEMMSVAGTDARTFAKLALQAAVAFFPSGYTHAGFLAYCALVIGVVNSEGFMDAAGGVIGTVLFGLLLSGDIPGPSEWTEAMTKVAEEFNQSVYPRVKRARIEMARNPRKISK